jgi:hypothetical protein
MSVPPPRKTIKERSEEVAFSRMMMEDLMRMMHIKDDPVACAKCVADYEAGDIKKYSISSGVDPSADCRFCDRTPEEIGQPMLRCSACKMVVYCGQECQKLDWKFHKGGCEILQSINLKGL